MLDHALNDALSRVGSGTPMGETMPGTGCPRYSPWRYRNPTARL